jgi:hypothetical protein
MRLSYERNGGGEVKRRQKDRNTYLEKELSSFTPPFFDVVERFEILFRMENPYRFADRSFGGILFGWLNR